MPIIALYNAQARRIAAGLVGICAVAVFLYGALLLGAVAHAAGRNSAEKELRKLSSAVSTLESEYLTETKSLSPERASAMGFVSPVSVATVYAGAQGLTLR